MANTLLTHARNLLRRMQGRRYVFIITYGRSGSTLLMNVINAADGCCIRGENNGTLYSLYRAYMQIVEGQKENLKGASKKAETHPWRGIHLTSAERYAQKLVKTFVTEILRPAPGDFLVGFKEIRFIETKAPDFAGYITFLQRFFPGAKIVFNHRNADDVAKSKWWSSWPDAKQIIAQLDEKFNAYQDQAKYFHFNYDEALKNRDHVRELFQFLNIGYDQQRVDEIFRIRHSY